MSEVCTRWVRYGTIVIRKCYQGGRLAYLDERGFENEAAAIAFLASEEQP